MLRTFSIIAVCLLSTLLPSQVAWGQDEEGDTGFTLKVVFDGLIAFVKEDSHVWALLVNAEYDPDHQKESDFPHCVWKETGRGSPKGAKIRKKEYPPHYAYIHFKNAKVYGPKGEVGDPIKIKGEDIRILTGSKGVGANLKILGSAEEVKDARGRRMSVDYLDKVKGGLLDLNPRTVTRKGDILAARVLVRTGEILAMPIEEKMYSFLRRGERHSCDTYNSCFIAEETVLEQEVNQEYATLAFLNRGIAYNVKPKDKGKPVEVEVLNVTCKYIKDIGGRGCSDTLYEHSNYRHLKSYRYFYDLAKCPKKKGCRYHFFPCDYGIASRAKAVGRKCPQKELVP